MIHRWLEEWYDTLMYIVVIFGALVFFLWYWRAEYQVRFAEIVLQEFLVEVSADGTITLEDYVELTENLEKINPGYEVEIKGIKRRLHPVYAVPAKENLQEFYMKRNRRAEVILTDYQPLIKEETEELLKLQEESNATIMAAHNQNYLPLPNEEGGLKIEALRPYQEVYEGEELITLCYVSSGKGSYYAVAESQKATGSGSVLLQLRTEGNDYEVPVEVVCYPRKLICGHGHKVVNSKQVLAEYRKTGRVKCPYCEVLPVDIVSNVAVVQKKTGTALTKEDVWTTVTYLDGHTEKITPDSADWQDTYDPYYCGIQNVTIHYRGKEERITVISDNGVCQACGKSCNERCYKDYIQFPFCTTCMSKVPLYTGKVYEEELWISGGEILACLDKTDMFHFQIGDFITVYLKDGKRYVALLEKEILQTGKGGEE